jgi:DNA polymerase-3 subunit alpha
LQGATAAQADRRRGQLSLFGAVEEPEQRPDDGLPEVEQWPESLRLANEKAVLGFYLSGHPLHRHREAIEAFATHRTTDLADCPHEQRVILGGSMSGVKFGTTRRPSRQGNSRMARFSFDDLHGSVPCVMFPDCLAEQAELVAEDRICFIVAKVDRSREQVSLIVERVVPIERAAEQLSRALVVNLDSSRHGVEQLEGLRTLLRRFPGRAEVYLQVRTSTGLNALLKADSKNTARPCRELAEAIEQLLGPNCVQLVPAGNGNNHNSAH